MITDREFLTAFLDEKCEQADHVLQIRQVFDSMFYMMDAYEKVYARAKFILDFHPDLINETCRHCSIECTCGDLLDDAVSFVEQLKLEDKNVVSQ